MPKYNGLISMSIFLLKQMAEKDKILPALMVLFIAATFTACMTKMSIRKEFDDTINNYNKLLTAQSLNAAGLFAAEGIAKEFSARAKAAKSVKMFDYRIVGTSYDEESVSAEVTVEIDYYSLSSFKMSTMLDIQKWEYVTEKGIKHWRLKSLLPEFH